MEHFDHSDVYYLCRLYSHIKTGRNYGRIKEEHRAGRRSFHTREDACDGVLFCDRSEERKTTMCPIKVAWLRTAPASLNIYSDADEKTNLFLELSQRECKHLSGRWNVRLEDYR